MELSTLNTPYQVLDRLLALNLSVTLWSARTKLTPEDFGGGGSSSGRISFSRLEEDLRSC